MLGRACVCMPISTLTDPGEPPLSYTSERSLAWVLSGHIGPYWVFDGP